MKPDNRNTTRRAEKKKSFGQVEAQGSNRPDGSAGGRRQVAHRRPRQTREHARHGWQKCHARSCRQGRAQGDAQGDSAQAVRKARCASARAQGGPPRSRQAHRAPYEPLAEAIARTDRRGRCCARGVRCPRAVRSRRWAGCARRRCVARPIPARSNGTCGNRWGRAPHRGARPFVCARLDDAS